MKKTKKLIVLCVVVIAIVVVVLFLTTGRARTDVYLKEFELSEDGKTMTLKVGVSNSAGYVRKIKQTSGSTNGYYTFYSTYGINSKNGAKDTFEIELNGETDEIYFYTGNKGYKIVLAKHKVTNAWTKINYADNETIKIDLLDKDNINKVGINTGAQDNNYFEYTDKDTIDKIYNIFIGLETTQPSTTFNPEVTEEMYAISFDTDEYEDKVEWSVDVYKRDNKYYVEQRYNGIYEITEENFNLIKSYVKSEQFEYEKETTEEVELKTEIDTMEHVVISGVGKVVKYKTYIKNNKLYAKNLETNEEKIIFDKEPVKNIASRKICCTGNAHLLILTNIGNVYMSEEDSNYGFTLNIKFNKLDAKDIVSFKLVPAFDYDIVKNLYGVDSEGKETLLHKMN